MPAAVAAIGFGIGHVSLFVYLTLWLINVGLILLIIRHLIKPKTTAEHRKFWDLKTPALLLILPWILFSVFAGIGPPPLTIKGWLDTAGEQQSRYTILICGGVSALMGFALLKDKLKDKGEQRYSTLGYTLISVAIPLFILNMAFWGYYLTEVFRYFITLSEGNRPPWYPPVKMFFYVVSVIEVVLIYMATILFAMALKLTGIITVRAYYWYMIIGISGAVLVLLPPSCPEPFATLSYLVAIPAIPFIMPYLMGVHLLRA